MPEPTPAELRRALAVDAVGPALNKHGAWLPDHVREAVADAVLAAVEPALEHCIHDAAGHHRHHTTPNRRPDLMPEPDMTAACNCGHPDPSSPLGHLLTCAVWDQQFGREPANPAPAEQQPEPSDPTQCTGDEGFCPEHGFHRYSLKQPGPDPMPGPTPTPAELRQRYAKAIHRYDYEHGLSGNDIPGAHHRGEADAVLAAIEPELQQLRQQLAEARTALRIAEGDRDAANEQLREELARVREWLPVIRRALSSLPETCRYHGDQLDPDRYGRMTRSEACCDTGIEPRRRREAMNALAAPDQPQEQP